jgi:hypothetical protein
VTQLSSGHLVQFFNERPFEIKFDCVMNEITRGRN